MKYKIKAIFVLITVLIANVFSAIDVSYVEPVRNGDQLNIQVTEVPANVQVKYIFLIKRNQGATNWREYALLEKKDLKISSNGIIEGKVTVKRLDINDAEATLWIELSDGRILTSNSFAVVGDEMPQNPNPELAGSFDILDNDGGTFDPDDQADASNGVGFSSQTILLTSIQERDGSDNVVAQTTPSSNTFAIDGSGNLTGSVIRDGSAFNASTQTISVFLLLGDFSTVTSTNRLNITISDPSLISATVTDFDKIELVFDEPVSESGAGDAAGMFNFGGTPTITASQIDPVGTPPTDTWELTISTITQRGPAITVAYDRTNTSGAILVDVSSNEVQTTSPAINASETIPPGATILDTPTLTTVMGSSVSFQATVTGALSDNSMDRVEFQGSPNGSTGWTPVDQDNTVDDETFNANYSFVGGDRYAYWRAVAFDNSGNSTVSPDSGSFIDAYRIQFTAWTTPLLAGERGEFTVTIQDNYTQAVSYGSNLSFNLETDQPSTGTFYNASSGGSPITSVVISTGNTAKTFWYEDYQSSSMPTLTIYEPAGNLPDSTDSYQIEISAASIDEFRVTTENSQNESAGTGFTVIVTAWDNDVGDVATDYVGAHSLDFTNTATASPDGTNPDTSGIADSDYTFIAGVCTTSAITFFNAGETPTITVTDGSTTTNGSFGAAAGVTVNAGSLTEVRIKTADETVDGNYNNNVFGDTTIQGPRQANPTVEVNLFAVAYDDWGNLRPDVSSGFWSKGSPPINGRYLSVPPINPSTEPFLFDSTGNSSLNGTVYSGVLNFLETSTLFQTFSTGTITVDDFAPATVTGFGITTDSENNEFVFATWSGSSSGDDGNSGTPTSYEIRWTDESNGIIDTDGEWNSATSVGNGGKPAFSAGTWHIDMSGFPAGNKYFAIRTFDDVGNISVLGSGSFTLTSDYSLPVDLVSFTSSGDYGKVVLKWETASELNNEGFFIHRSLQSDGNYEQVNSEIIPGNGNSNTAHQYEYADKNVEGGKTYYYKLISRDFNGTLTEYESIVSATVLAAPTTFSIAQNYPNPFNPQTNFRFSIAEPSRASLRIYDVLGQKVRTIFDNRLFDMGVYDEFSWNATDDAGNQVANGVYYYEFKIPSQNIRQVKKMLYLK